MVQCCCGFWYAFQLVIIYLTHRLNGSSVACTSCFSSVGFNEEDIRRYIRDQKPVIVGLVSTLSASRSASAGDDKDRDLSPAWILVLTAVCLIIAGWLAFTFARSTVLAPSAMKLMLIAVPFVLLGGFLIAGICGYMAGLTGASNSPISGVGILSIVLCASTLIVAVSPTPQTSASSLQIRCLRHRRRLSPPLLREWLAAISTGR